MSFLCLPLLSFFSLAAQAQDPNAALFKINGEYLQPKVTGSLGLNWLPDGAGYLVTEPQGNGHQFYAVDPVTEAKTPLFSTGSIQVLAKALQLDPANGLPFERFTREMDGHAIRFAHDGKEYLFDLESHNVKVLVLPDVPAPEPLLFYLTPSPVFSADFEQYAYVKNYEIFVASTSTGDEKQVTSGGTERTQYGQLGVSNGLVWSPDGSQLAYLKCDYSETIAYPFMSEMSQQPEISYLGYPFASGENPPCSLKLLDVRSGDSATVTTNTEEVPFVRDMRWRSDGSELLVTLQSRWFDKLILQAYSPETGKTRQVLQDEVDTFMNPNDNFRILSDNRRFIWSSERSGFEQIYLYDLDGRLLQRVTDVPWETGHIEAVDEKAEWIYFQGSPGNGTENHLYRVKFDGTQLTDLTPEKGYHRVSMDRDANYFTDMHSSLATTPRVTLNRADGELIRQIGSVAVTSDTTLPTPEIIKLTTADGKSDMYGTMFKPMGFDPQQQYPLLVYVYGGPHSKSTSNSYQSISVNAQMAQFGFIVVQIDARGTPGRGKVYQSGNYLGWGQNDVDDQAAAAQQLGERPYIDASRVGIFGISHGGYMTLMAMLRHPEVFKVGVSGAPITVLENGPDQYVQRPMRSPQANPEGYARGNVLNHVDGLQGKLLIYHGTADQNALKVNSMLLVDALINAGKSFDFMVYPEGEHVMQGQRYRHVMTKQLAYFLEYLKPEGWEASLQQIWADLAE